jgi:hypothetical protein
MLALKNPNVMFELGMRLAFDKPAIIIKDNRTNYSFDTARKTVNGQTSFLPANDSVLHRHISNETRTQWAINNALKTENEMIEFLKSYLGDNINQKALTDLQDPGSELFKALFKRLCKHGYTHDYLGETEHLERDLVSAASRLNHALISNNWTAPE